MDDLSIGGRGVEGAFHGETVWLRRAGRGFLLEDESVEAPVEFPAGGGC